MKEVDWMDSMDWMDKARGWKARVRVSRAQEARRIHLRSEAPEKKRQGTQKDYD